MVPTMLRTLFTAQANRSGPALAELTELGQLIVGGEALGADLQAKIRQALPRVRLFDVYGTTETRSSKRSRPACPTTSWASASTCWWCPPPGRR